MGKMSRDELYIMKMWAFEFYTLRTSTQTNLKKIVVRVSL